MRLCLPTRSAAERSRRMLCQRAALRKGPGVCTAREMREVSTEQPRSASSYSVANGSWLPRQSGTG
jgi:hypothetical protein